MYVYQAELTLNKETSSYRHVISGGATTQWGQSAEALPTTKSGVTTKLWLARSAESAFHACGTQHVQHSCILYGRGK
jgi:hypothetical protein